MTTLLLTSAGVKMKPIVDEFLKLLPGKPENSKLAHIITAVKMAHDLSYVEKDKKAFKKLGIPYEDIDIEGKTAEELRHRLQEFDVIYVQGGDPYYLLKHIKLSGFDLVVRELIQEGKLYVGVSAGSYVACPTIESTLWKKPRRTRHGLRDDEPAMDLVNFLIVVHYEDRHRDVIKNGIKYAKLSVRVLTDDQALLVHDGQVILVGSGEEINI